MRPYQILRAVACVGMYWISLFLPSLFEYNEGFRVYTVYHAFGDTSPRDEFASWFWLATGRDSTNAERRVLLLKDIDEIFPKAAVFVACALLRHMSSEACFGQNRFLRFVPVGVVCLKSHLI